MSVILFKNSFGITLDSGPITIFDTDKCIGEAMVDSTPAGETKFIAYGIERQIKCKQDSKNELQPYHASEVLTGQLKLTRYRRYIQTYAFNHSGSIDVEGLYLEHPFRKGKQFSLVATPLPVSKTENFYRFFLQAKAGQITTYAVQEQILEVEYHSLYRISSGTANTWLANGYISRDIFNALVNEIIPLQERIDIEKKVTDKESQELSAAVNQQRSDYNTVNSRTSPSARTCDRDLMNRVKSMIAQEDTIRRLRVSVTDKQLTQKQDNAALTNRIQSLSYKGEVPLPKEKTVDTSKFESKSPSK